MELKRYVHISEQMERIERNVCRCPVGVTYCWFQIFTLVSWDYDIKPYEVLSDLGKCLINCLSDLYFLGMGEWLIFWHKSLRQLLCSNNCKHCVKVHTHVTSALAFFFNLCRPVLENANIKCEHITCYHRLHSWLLTQNLCKCRYYVWIRPSVESRISRTGSGAQRLTREVLPTSILQMPWMI